MNNTVKKIALRDVQIALMDAQLDGMIIPDVVFEIIKQVEDSYDQDLPFEVVNELTERD